MAEPADSEEAARALVASLQRTHFDATHVCSAWRLRDGVWRANDAGEPSGSAGAPILAAIEAAGLSDVVLAVVRWFGGTKLGVGGLIRAYAEAAEAALAAAPRREGVPAVRILIRYPYPHTAAVMRALEASRAAAMEYGYSVADTTGEVSAIIPRFEIEPLTARLREQTSGEVAPEIQGARLLYRPPPQVRSGSA